MKIARSLVISTLAAAPLAALAQSSVSVWGKLDLSVDRTKNGPASAWTMEDNASRLGFRGVEDLGGGMKAHFGIENGFNADTGTSPTSATSPFYRNTYVGLQHISFGALSIGRLDTNNPAGSPIYSIITTHITPVIHDSGAPAIGTPVLNNRNRYNNSINYRAPTFAGLTFRARVSLNGANSAAVTEEAALKNFDASLNYAFGDGGIAVGLSKDKFSATAPANSFDSKWTVVGSYKFGPVKLQGTYGRDKYNVTSASRRKEVPYWLGGVTAEIGEGKLIANVGQRAVQADINGRLRVAQIGYGYDLSKRTTLYALFDQRDPNTNVANDKIRTFSAGIQHDF